MTITDSVVDANGDVTINFQAIDLISGVDTDRVLVNGNAVSVTDTDGVAKGSFKADGSATYTIVAYDNAGNKSAEVSFEPLGLEVTPVTAITNTTAHIEAQVIQEQTHCQRACAISSIRKRLRQATIPYLSIRQILQAELR